MIRLSVIVRHAANARREVLQTLMKAIWIIQYKIERDAKLGSPHLSGHNKNRLASDLMKPRDGKLEGNLHTESGYGGYLELGTGIHGPKKELIRPKNGKVMVWNAFGAYSLKTKKGIKSTKIKVVARSVKGIKARPYIVPAVMKHRDELQDALESLR